MEDLSSLARDSMWCTSQAAGNRQSMPDTAMTAPGSDPVDRELKTSQMSDPKVIFSNPEQIAPGTDPKRLPGAGHPQPPDWSRHANEKPAAGTYDEPSFGQARSGTGPWRQV